MKRIAFALYLLGSCCFVLGSAICLFGPED